MAFIGALARKTADQTTADYDPVAVVAWDGTDIYDTDAFHDPSSNNSRITISSSVNGLYGTIKTNLTVTSIDTTATVYASIFKNGAAGWMGWSGRTRLVGAGGFGADGSTKLFLQVSTPPILLTTGDYYEVAFFSSDVSVTVVAASSSFGIQVVRNLSTARGVLAKKNADQALANYSTPAAVAWDGTDVYDTDAAHSPSSSNTKIIIPSAWNGLKGVLAAMVRGSSATANTTASLAIQKGGSDAYDGFGGNSKNNGNFGEHQVFCETQPIVLSTAEEYEARLYSADNNITIQEEHSSFGLWIVE